MTDQNTESKRAGPKKMLAWIDRYPRIAWYIAVISTLNTVLLVFHPFG